MVRLSKGPLAALSSTLLGSQQNRGNMMQSHTAARHFVSHDSESFEFEEKIFSLLKAQVFMTILRVKSR
jgi:hypothetical protein